LEVLEVAADLLEIVGQAVHAQGAAVFRDRDPEAVLTQSTPLSAFATPPSPPGSPVLPWLYLGFQAVRALKLLSLVVGSTDAGPADARAAIRGGHSS
jgi:hypothetical protein